MKKRIISMLMSVAMMLCVMPCAFATDYTTIDGWKITSNGKAYKL